MSGLLSNARRALLRPANPRDDTHTASRIIGATLPVTIASTLFRHRSMFSDRPTSFHQPPPALHPEWGGFQPCGILHTVGAAAAPPPPHPCEGGRGMGAQGHTLPHSHSKVIFLYFSPLKGNLQNFI
nr:MAG TPA: hypothetical protein [Caudoviricetes sp.]